MSNWREHSLEVRTIDSCQFRMTQSNGEEYLKQRMGGDSLWGRKWWSSTFMRKKKECNHWITVNKQRER